MFNLKSLGKIEFAGYYGQITVEKDYIKALKYVDCFSHIHIFFACGENEKHKMEVVIGRIISMEEKKGILEINLTEEFNTKGDLLDIKPYFPCEDSVKSSSNIKEISREVQYIEEKDRGLYTIDEIGVIRSIHGKTYIETVENMKVETPYVKVLWWFHKFDSDKYRKATQCNPPYENAPRTGIFASRSPVRPNPVAMTVARITEIDRVRKRIYLSGIECFDKTPCIGILDYDRSIHLIEKARVPQWLEHWPKWFDDGERNMKNEISINESGLIDLLEEGREIVKDKEEAYKHSRDKAITVTGARENNLKGIEVKIPYGKVTAVTGVSGSGKSSLVVDTIYAECKRRMNCLTSERSQLQKPEADYISGCIPAVMISQQGIRGNSQSTIGTYTGAYDYLRMIYASVGIRHCPKCGKEIIPLSRETILNLITSRKKVTILDLDKNEIAGDSLEDRMDKALNKSQGALYADFGDGELILMQTRGKCYRCDKLLFDMTPAMFSYTDAESRCPICNGTGMEMKVDEDSIVEDPEKSLLDGASSFFGKLSAFRANPNANWMKGQVLALADELKVDLKKPWKELPEEFKQKVLHGTGENTVTFTYVNRKNGRKGEITRPVEGVCQIITRIHDENHNSALVDKYIEKVTCHHCRGERLGREGRMVTLGSRRYPEAASMSFDELKNFLQELPVILGKDKYERVFSSILKLREIVKAAESLGIGYLKLSRGITQVSQGEGQRLKLMVAMENHMSGILYIFDEPSKGLHPKDYSKVAQMIYSLKEEGNTVIMVEHNEDMIRIADNIIEIGPGAGERGGTLVGQGSPYEMIKTPGKIPMKHSLSNEFIELKNLHYNNLKNISVAFPKNGLTCICGVSGSGKSSLMRGELNERLKLAGDFDEVILVDQVPNGGTSRSVTATYVGVMDGIRMLMASSEDATIKGYEEKYFSFNGDQGQCSTCKGEGRIKVKYMENSYETCPDCRGKRYKREVLKIRYKDKTIADILNLSVEEAIRFFSENSEIVYRLKMVESVGLGYLKLGQGTGTLSGGEISRLKLSRELMGTKHGNTLYLLDEPTTGLNFSDVENLLKLLDSMILNGSTVVAVEHNKQFTSCCDWLIEMGPGAGDMGGEVIYNGECKIIM